MRNLLFILSLMIWTVSICFTQPPERQRLNRNELPEKSDEFSKNELLQQLKQHSSSGSQSLNFRSGGDIGDPPDLNWTEQLGKYKSDRIIDMVRDTAGNIYACGIYSGTLKIGGETYHSSGLNNGFILKLGQNGGFEWFKSLETTENEKSQINALTIGGNGTVLFTGQYSGSALFEGQILSDKEDVNGLVVRVDELGNIVWTRIVTVIGFESNIGIDIAKGEMGTVYTLVAEHAMDDRSKSAVLALNTEGTVDYESTFPDEFSAFVIGTSQGNYYINGLLRGPVDDFGGFHLDPEGYNDILTLKYDNSHQLMWASLPSGPDFASESQDGRIADLDSAGNMFFTGSTRNMVIFGSDTIVHDPEDGALTYFLSKCTSDGEYEWAVEIDETNTIEADQYIYTAKDSMVSIYNSSGGEIETYDLSNYTDVILSAGNEEFILAQNMISDLMVRSFSSGTVQWTTSTSGTFDNGIIYEMVSDQEGSLYTLGRIYGSVDFYQYDGAGIQFLAKHDASGQLQWIYELPIDLFFDRYSSPQRQLVLDPGEEHIYFVGGFQDEVQIGKELLLAEKEGYSNSGENICIAKFNTDGTLEWVRNQTSEWNLTTITVGKDVYYIGGRFEDTMTVNGTDFASRGSFDLYYSCYNKDGQYQWTNTAGGASRDYGTNLGTAGGDNLYISAEIAGTGSVDFIDTTIWSLPMDGHIYLAKVDKEGTVHWLHRYGRDLNDPFTGANQVTFQTDMFTTSEGYVYLKGWYGDNVAFGDHVLKSTFGIGIGLFIAKFDQNGEPSWIKSIQRENIDFEYNEMDVDKNGNVYMGFPVRDAVYFGSEQYTPLGNDLLVAKYNSRGKLVWVKAMEGIGSHQFQSIGDHSIQSVCVWDTTAIFVTGIVNGHLEIGDQTLNTAVNSSFVTMFGTEPATVIQSPGSITYGLYPNPTTDYVNIEFPRMNQYVIRVHGLEGKKYIQKHTNGRETTLDLNNLNPGVYFISIDDGSRSATKKIIIE